MALRWSIRRRYSSKALHLHRLILDLLKYPEQADKQVRAIHDKPEKHEADERDLRIADVVARLACAAAEVGVVGFHAWEVVVPICGGGGRAADDGGEEVVEAEGEGGRPGADEECLGEGVEEFGGGAPEA